MSTRTERRHPRVPVEELLTTRKEIIAFAAHISTDPVFCKTVVATAEIVRHNEAIVAEHKRREAWPRWRKTVHKLWLRVR